MSTTPFKTLPNELVEHIFSYLPMGNLLCAQSVCKKWHKTIERSGSLQRALFFVGTPKPYPPRPLGENGETYAINPLFRRFLRSSMKQADNPRCFLSHATADSQSYQLPTASWRNMFVTKPVCKRLVLVIMNDDQPAYESGNQLVQCEQGITMGYLVQKLERKLESFRSENPRWLSTSYRYGTWFLHDPWNLKCQFL